MTDYLDIRPEVAEALAAGRAVVALESTVIAHGLPAPRNIEAAQGMAAAVRESGAVPAMVAVLDGRVRIGLSPAEVERLANADAVAKVSRRDLAAALAYRGLGATTVAATMACAARAGIRVFATGGLGGVHRGGERSLDVSADLTELGRSPVAVVCAGAKAILDLPRTLEVLETNGVPVIGYGTVDFPAFFSRASGLTLPAQVDTAEAAAALLRAHWGLGLDGGMVIASPPPEDSALDAATIAPWIARALAEAEAGGVRGGAVTPYLLARLAVLSDGRTIEANIALLEHNARLAGQIAAAYAELASE